MRLFYCMCISGIYMSPLVFGEFILACTPHPPLFTLLFSSDPLQPPLLFFRLWPLDHRFRALIGRQRVTSDNPKDIAHLIMNALPSTFKDAFQLGHTKIFLREVRLSE